MLAAPSTSDPKDFLFAHLKVAPKTLPELVLAGRDQGISETALRKTAQNLIEQGALSVDTKMRIVF